MCVTASEDCGSESTTPSDAGGTKVHDDRIVLGYMRKHLLMSDLELIDAKERLCYFAKVQRLRLGTIYVEEIETWLAAFEALIADATKKTISGVLMPSMLHFAVLGAPRTVRQHFEDATQTRVIVAMETVSFSPGEAAS